MPSVGGMRRTRVFGLVKGSDGARVLRSGRLLWLGPGEDKPRKTVGSGEVRMSEPNNSSVKSTKDYSGINCLAEGKENGWAHISKLNQEQSVAGKTSPAASTRVLRCSSRDAINKDRRIFGSVYNRKRKRKRGMSSVPERQDLLSADSMYGIQFSRMQGAMNEQQRCFSVVLEGVFSCVDVFGQLFVSVLFYMKTFGLRLSLLGAFLLSEPVCSAFGSAGIRFSWDPPSNRIGFCKLFGDLQLVPLFTVDFSSIPSCFLYMHLRLVFRMNILLSQHVNNFSKDDAHGDHPRACLFDNEVDKPSFWVKNGSSNRKASLKEADTSRGKAAHPSVRASKLVGQSRLSRNNLGSRGIQQTRSSMRRKRAGDHIFRLQNTSAKPIVIGLACSGKRFIAPHVIFKNASGWRDLMTRSVDNGQKPRRNSELDIVKFHSTSPKLLQDYVKSLSVSPKSALDSIKGSSSSCFANLLIIEADRCFRIEEVTILQEVSNSSDWMLVVKKDGRTFCSHLAQRSMKPCSFNRVTHDVIWSTDETWKLEFPNRQDWFIFKDLYKECSDHNVPTRTPKVIHVPGVLRVLDNEDTCCTSFCRPDSYISLNSNEIERALARKCANYDLDSEDEEWLNSFNHMSIGKNENQEILMEDNFELMIDTFEKVFYCNPDDFMDEKAAVSICKEIAEEEVIGVVYNYWVQKRKQKQSALLRVFQVHQPKRAPVIPKPAFRKKRSFKRHPSLFGRGKRPSLWQGKHIGGEVNNYRFSWQDGLQFLGSLLYFPAVIASEQDALQKQNAQLKVDEAKESAKGCIKSSTEKRQRAQLLMENADLAVYKAVIALKIAESASCHGATTHFTCETDWQK